MTREIFLCEGDADGFGKSSIRNDALMNVKYLSIERDQDIIPARCFAFSRCLETITFEHDSICRELCTSAFESSNIKAIFIPKSLEVIAARVFAGCKCLESINFEQPSRLRKIGFQAFAEAFKPNSRSPVWLPDTLEILENSCFMNSNIMNICITGNKLLTLPALVFGNTAIQHILIPKSIQSLKCQCFCDCSALTNVEFEKDSQLNEIGSSVFQNTSLKTIKIPERVTKIGHRCFYGCRNLEEIDFETESQLLSIGSMAFSFTRVRDILITDNLQEVTGAFIDSRATVTLSRRNSCFTISDGLLMTKDLKSVIHCFTPIHHVQIPATTEKLQASCFEGCQTLETVEFCEKSCLREIGDSAFKRSSLARIIIPNSVKYIGTDAFSSCYNLTDVQFSTGIELEELPIRCFYNSKIATLEIPACVKVIGDQCFECCAELTSVLFTRCSCLSKVGGGAFRGCSKIEEITFPVSVKRIASDCFDECERLISAKYDTGTAVVIASDDESDYSDF